MWGALKNVAQVVSSDLSSLTKDTLNQAQQLLEKLDGDNEEIDEDPDGRIDDDEEDDVEIRNATDQDTSEVTKEVVQVSACSWFLVAGCRFLVAGCWYQ